MLCILYVDFINFWFILDKFVKIKCMGIYNIALYKWKNKSLNQKLIKNVI